MTGLQEAFYIISIIYMSVMFILIIALIVVVVKIRNKVNHIQHAIEDKVYAVTHLAEKGGELAGMAAAKVAAGAAKAVRKSKK